LESQLGFLVRRGYRGETFTRALTRRPSGRTLVVTFDDAFKSVYDLAAPILTRLGLPASLFVPTDYIETGEPIAWAGTDHWLAGEHREELSGMNWDEIRSLAHAGWEIGSHTGSHPFLTRIGDQALANELQRSRQTCEERLNQPCWSLAYPYGDVDVRVVAAAREAGYTAAATLPSRLRPLGPLEWPRVGVYHDDSTARFRLKASRLVRRTRGSNVWSLVDRTRKRTP
jgi:peptidoglycan/xylan/chitin deacetylase (PgdA/CDA1 family)